MRELLSRTLDVPFHRLFRTLGRPVTAPLEISFALSYKCACRCRTCHSLSMALEPEMTPEEYSTVFQRISFQPFSVTLTGGEPFLRENFMEIAASACAELAPAIVFIETCGDLPDFTSEAIRELTDSFPGVWFAVKIPLDGTQEKMDWMRGDSAGSFERFLQTFSILKTMPGQNLATVIGVPVSKYNEDTAAGLLREAFRLYPDAVALEFAGRMEALGAPASVSPDPGKLPGLLASYRKLAREHKTQHGTPRMLMNLYSRRAAAAATALSGEGRRGLCYAGFSSIYVSPSGSVMDCPGAKAATAPCPRDHCSRTRYLLPLAVLRWLPQRFEKKSVNCLLSLSVFFRAKTLAFFL
ncbi:radical SAM protein [bacterium]